MFKKLILRMAAGLLLIITAGGGLGYWLHEYQLKLPLPLPEHFQYTLQSGANLRQVALELVEQKIFNYPTAAAWLMIARWQKKTTQIKAGEYAVPAGTNAYQLLDIFISGKFQVEYPLTIVEGWNFRQVLQAIHKHPKLVKTLTGLDDNEIMAKLGFSGIHPEGRFFPDTYAFTAGTTDVVFLQRAYRKMSEELAAAWKQRQENLPLKTPEEALILASIVEKETALAEERPLISGVFIRRIQLNMRLQTDPTVIYGLGESFDGNLRSADLTYDTPYNTYLHNGLPPTPIAMSGRAALLAAINPAPGDALYFVAKGNSGAHYFSATLKEHECAVIEYQLKTKAPNLYRSRCRQFPTCAACQQNAS